MDSTLSVSSHPQHFLPFPYDLPIGILFQGTSKFSGHTLKSTVELELFVLETLGVYDEVEFDDEKSSIVVSKSCGF